MTINWCNHIIIDIIMGNDYIRDMISILVSFILRKFFNIFHSTYYITKASLL